MIVIGTFKDEIVDGQRRAAGKKLRHLVVLGVDKFNLVLAMSKGDNPLQGMKYYPKLDMLKNCLVEFGLDVEECLRITREAFSRLGDAAGLSWAEIDKEFSVTEPVRTKFTTTGELTLYRRLQEVGFDDSEGNSEKEVLVA